MIALNTEFPDLAYNGCPDYDGDGIPDVVDVCPGSPEETKNTNGGVCYSGCPDRGNDPDTNLPYDEDKDGVSDCLDRCPGVYAVGSPDGCPDFDLDGVPDTRDYCPTNPGTAEFSYVRKLEEDGDKKYLNILGCPDRDGDLVPDQADFCDAPSYPNQDSTALPLTSNANIDGTVVVDNKGCPLDSDAVRHPFVSH